jgi:hypothetical protein
LASFDVAAAPGDQALSVAWRYDSTRDFVSKLHLDLFRIVNGDRVRVASNIIGHTVEPDAYTIPVSPGDWLIRATPENAAGFGDARESGVVTVTNACFSATLCARVSPTSSAGTVRLVGQGFLAGVKTSADIEALNPKQWRFSGDEHDATVKSLGASRTQILSDLWNSATVGTNAGYARTPWSDWAAWQTFVRNTVLTSKSRGSSPDYWDVWNEPNGTCCPRFSPSDVATVTIDRWLQTYELAWKTIKAADPTAKVIGPSLSALQWAPGSPAEFDLDTFLAYSAAHGVTWDAVSWHENTLAPSPGDIVPSVTNVDRHIAMAREVMVRHPGSVVNDTMLVNEYGPADTHMLAGWSVGFLRALEDGGVSQANLACWSEVECTSQLDGLLDTAGQRTAVWWAHKFYGDLGGGTRMSVASTASSELDGLATQDDAAHAVRVLLGRHVGCNGAVNRWCSSGSGVGSASLAVTINWPYGTAPVTVSNTRLPAGTTALLTPQETVGPIVLQPVAGSLTVFVPNLGDGDALWIVAHPA